MPHPPSRVLVLEGVELTSWLTFSPGRVKPGPGQQGGGGRGPSLGFIHSIHHGATAPALLLLKQA